jgi:hypothetical protein
LTRADLYTRFVSRGDQMDYILPVTILAGGAFFARQPSARKLIQDLARYIGKVQALFRYLCPPWHELPIERNRLFDSSGTKAKQEAASEISKACFFYSRSTPLFRESRNRPPDLRTLLVKIGADMSSVLFSDPADQDKTRGDFELWAWARLLEQVYYTEVSLSLNLFN